MATIKERTYENDGKITIKFKATVTLKDCPRVSKTFDRRTDALNWAQKTEYEFKHQLIFGHA